MLTHLARMSAVTAVFMLFTLLPFLPGRYDRLAVPLSVMAQLAGKAGLVLVPIGAAWLAYEFRNRARPESAAPKQGRRRFAIAALVAGSFVCLIVSLGAFAAGLFAGAAALALSAYIVAGTARRLNAISTTPTSRVMAVALYLLLLPSAVLSLQVLALDSATEFSRGRAIRNAARLIADIERYRAEHGQYPQSLLSEWEDYPPSVIGIRRYDYERSGEAYNLAFEQLATQLDTREFVVYNPLGQQTMTSHNRDLLEFTAAALDVRRGYYAVHTTPYEHWRYFLFD